MSVYFIKDSQKQFIKIGYAHNPDRRLKELQTGSPLQLELIGYINGGQAIEQAIQVYYNHLHIRGEWYRYDTGLIRFIEDLISKKEEAQTFLQTAILYSYSLVEQDKAV